MSSDSDSDSDNNRPRTHSGNIITWNAKDLRTFFTKKTEYSSEEADLNVDSTQEIGQACGEQYLPTHVNRDQALKRFKQRIEKKIVKTKAIASASATSPITRSRSKQLKIGFLRCDNTPISSTEAKPTTEEQLDEEVIQYLASKMKQASEKIQQQECESDASQRSDDNSTSQEAIKEVNSTDELVASDTVLEGATAAMEVENEEAPTTINAITVQAMFQKIQGQITAMEKDLQKIKDKPIIELKKEALQTCINQVLNQVDHKLNKDREEVKSLKEELLHEKKKNSVLVDTVNRMHVSMEDLTQRINNIELNNARKAVIITGLETRNKKADLINDVMAFIDQKLGVLVSIDDCYKLGGVDPRPVVVSFQSYEEKRDVLHFKSHLKGDPATSKIYINEYTPSVIQERRRREQAIIQDNERLQDEDKLEIKFGKGGLLIQNENYRKKVRAPTPKEIIDRTANQMTNLLKLKCVKGDAIVQDKSIFTGYTASVSSHKEIRDLYIKLKICEPSARHIVCAYRIEGSELHYCNDFWDDEEPGAGRTILEAMAANDISSRVIFVARKYGGVKLSGGRFDCYFNAAKKALENDPMNAVNGRAQHLLERRIQQPRRDSKKTSSGVDTPQSSTSVKRPASSPQDLENKRRQTVRPHTAYSKSYQRSHQHQYRYRGRAGRQQRLNMARFPYNEGDERSYGRKYENQYGQNEYEEYSDFSNRPNTDWSSGHDWSGVDDGRFQH